MRTIRARPAERLVKERERMRPLPETELRFTMRVPPQPYLRWDTNEYSLDPASPGGASRRGSASAGSAPWR